MTVIKPKDSNFVTPLETIRDKHLVTERVIRRPEVQARTSLSRSGVYARFKSGSPGFDPTFPKPINLGGRSVGWLLSEVEAWIAQRVAARSEKEGGAK